MQNMKFLIIAVMGLFLCALGRADWQADMSIKTKKGESMTGKAFFKMPKMRMDMNMRGHSSSMIVDSKARKAMMVMHDSKKVMTLDMSQAHVDVPPCDLKDLEGCLARSGFKKTGTETANGHSCTVYERFSDPKTGKKHHMKMWRANDLSEMVVVKNVSYDEAGELMHEVDFTDIKTTTLAAATFEAPAGYQAMAMPNFSAGGRPDMSQFMTNGKMDPEKIRKMKEMMQKQRGTSSGE